MQVDRIDLTQRVWVTAPMRPADYQSFIGQKPLIKIVQTAIMSAKTSGAALGHLLFTWPSGHGKTTLARIIASDMQVRVHQITAYALGKPAEIISLLNSLQHGDILFIDELHRLKPIIEEVLYVAMEDYSIDMLMPDGKPLRLSLSPFTLIGATTKSESLTPPLKNRFVYKLHFTDYTSEEKQQILLVCLDRLGICLHEPLLAEEMCSYFSSTPREISNTIKQLHDRLIAHHGTDDLLVTPERREQFRHDLQLQQWGLTAVHQSYLEVLQTFHGRPVGLKTIAVTLGMHEKAIEEDIEPLLLKLGKIEKTGKGRIQIV